MIKGKNQQHKRILHNNDDKCFCFPRERYVIICFTVVVTLLNCRKLYQIQMLMMEIVFLIFSFLVFAFRLLRFFQSTSVTVFIFYFSFYVFSLFFIFLCLHHTGIFGGVPLSIVIEKETLGSHHASRETR